MTDRASERLQLDGAFWLETMGTQLTQWFTMTPASHVSVDLGGWIALSGEGWSGFNVCCVLDHPRAAPLFEHYAMTISHLPALLLVEKVTPEILESAAHIDARNIGDISLMTWDDEDVPLSVDSSVVVRQITTLAELTPTTVLVSGSLSINLQACVDVFEPMLDDANAAIWVGEKDGHIVSAAISLRDWECQPEMAPRCSSKLAPPRGVLSSRSVLT
jgi:hypothetical protein